ncbi:MAG: TadE family protein [Desulfobacterales bacterium]
MPVFSQRRKGIPLRAPCSGRRGASLVEFALILFALVSLLFGIVDWGLYFFNRQVITNATREGARAGVVSREVRLTPEQIRNVVLDYSNQYLVTFGDGNPPVVVVQRQCPNFGCDLRVSSTFNYNFLFFRMFSPAAITVSATMKME